MRGSVVACVVLACLTHVAVSVEEVYTDGCPAGQKLLRTTGSDEGKCVACPPGTYSEKDWKLCLPCNVGEVSDAGAAKCTPCASSEFALEGNCVPCPAGSNGGQTGNVVCSFCEMGKIASKDGQAECTSCPSGSISKSLTECMACPAGTYAAEPWECKRCPTGKYSGKGQPTCTDCPVGTAANELGSINCTKCDVGYAAVDLGQSACKPVDCPAHSIRSSMGCMCIPGYNGTVVWDEVSQTYGGTCTPCPNGYWSTEGERCVKVPCPAGTNNMSHPFCKCARGYHTTEIQWGGGLFAGVCTQKGCPLNGHVVTRNGKRTCECAAGHVYTSDGRCERCGVGQTVRNGVCTKTECPAFSRGEPLCMCEPGHSGNLRWDEATLSYTGACLPCNTGSWAVPGGSCEVVDCPVNADTHPGAWPRCTCKAGFKGALSWVGGSYTGECVACPAGYWSEAGSDACKRVNCPDESGDHPGCTCSPGHYGQVNWVPDVGAYIGGCLSCPPGTWAPAGADTCVAWEPPANSVRSGSGFVCLQGHQVVDGACEPCPEGTFQDEITDGAECKPCGPGLGSSLGATSCFSRVCPRFSSGWPNCKCEAGYGGTIMWDAKTSDYVGKCGKCSRGVAGCGTGKEIKVKCPENAEYHPFCDCKVGFAGQIGWNSVEEKYFGTCVKLECPNHASGWPNCVCEPGSSGIITFDSVNQAYTGECRLCGLTQLWEYQDRAGQASCKPCANNYKADKRFGATKCKKMECPGEGQVGHPDCVCPRGTFMEADGLTCTKCPVGSWATRGSSACNPVPCPWNSTKAENSSLLVGYINEYMPPGTYFPEQLEKMTPPQLRDALRDVMPADTFTEEELLRMSSDQCVCNEGLEGYITFSEDGYYVGTCASPGCGVGWAEMERGKPGLIKVNKDPTTKNNGCDCAPGYFKMFSDPLVCEPCPHGTVWSLETERCMTAKTCPMGAGPSFGDDGYPKYVNGAPAECVCHEGYHGELVWVPGDQPGGGWVGECTKCPPGFTTNGRNMSDCLPIDCPAPSVYNTISDKCVCADGFQGNVMIHNAKEYSDVFVCKECGKGFFSVRGNPCLPVVCPENAVGHPDCVCAIGFQGELVWDLGLQKFIGECTPNPKGYTTLPAPLSDSTLEDPGATELGQAPETAPTMMNYVASRRAALMQKATPQSPEHSTDTSDITMAQSGANAFAAYGVVNRLTPGTGLAKFVECPENAHGHPDCQCDDMYEGKVMWDPKKGEYDSSCSACPYGYFSYSGAPCQKVQCPIGAEGDDCKCMSGWMGSVEWDAVSGRWTGQCTICVAGTYLNTALGQCQPCQQGHWSDDSQTYCTPVKCPPFSSPGANGCLCDMAYTGALYFSGGQWIGECTMCEAGYAVSGTGCVEVGCPSGSSGHPTCTCDAGFGSSPSPPSWNPVSGSYDGGCGRCGRGLRPAKDKFSEACIMEECPRNAESYPNCMCKRGFGGKLTWQESTSEWVGTCTRCPSGQTGVNGTCTPVPCPVDTVGYPKCRCRSGFGGSVYFSTSESKFISDCKPCARGLTSDTSPTSLLTYDDSAEETGVSFEPKTSKTTCKPLVCPDNAKPWPRCMCNFTSTAGIHSVNIDRVAMSMENHSNKIMWTSTGWQGTCSDPAAPTCGEGYEGDPMNEVPCTKCPPNSWSTDAGNCVAVDCPPRSLGYPKCQCEPGTAGEITFRRGLFYGRCVECPSGYWASADTSKCELQACPENAVNFPHCQCKAGFQGQLVWSAGRWVGKCTMCPKGTFATQGADQCSKVSCPAKSVGHPDCTCATDFSGNLVWDVKTGSYEGSCTRCPVGFRSDPGSNECSMVACPPHSQNHPNCACKTSYSGKLQWDPDLRDYGGQCVACPAGETTGADGKCVYEPPPKSMSAVCSKGECQCTDGHVGIVWWQHGKYYGQCQAVGKGHYSVSGTRYIVSCPPHAENHPECRCAAGYAGDIIFDEGKRMYQGKCERCPEGYFVDAKSKCSKATCPANSGGKVCKCNVGYEGVLTFEQAQSRWVGECVQCPKGYTSKSGVCEAVECPPLTEKHPYCGCVAGYHGMVVWNPEKLRYEGECGEYPSTTPSATVTPSTSTSASRTPSQTPSPSTLFVTPSPTPSPSPCTVNNDLLLEGAGEADGRYQPCHSVGVPFTAGDMPDRWCKGDQYHDADAYTAGVWSVVYEESVGAGQWTVYKGVRQWLSSPGRTPGLPPVSIAPNFQTFATMAGTDAPEVQEASFRCLYPEYQEPKPQLRKDLLRNRQSPPPTSYEIILNILLKGVAVADVKADIELSHVVREGIVEALGVFPDYSKQEEQSTSIMSTKEGKEGKSTEVKISILTGSEESTRSAIKYARSSQALTAGVQQVCKLFACSAPIKSVEYVSDLVVAARMGEDAAANREQMPSTYSNCSDLSDKPAGLCAFYYGCGCSDSTTKSGVEWCSTCFNLDAADLAKPLIPSPPVVDPEVPLEDLARSERAKVGMWKAMTKERLEAEEGQDKTEQEEQVMQPEMPPPSEISDQPDQGSQFGEVDAQMADNGFTPPMQVLGEADESFENNGAKSTAASVMNKVGPPKAKAGSSTEARSTASAKNEKQKSATADEKANTLKEQAKEKAGADANTEASQGKAGLDTAAEAATDAAASAGATRKITTTTTTTITTTTTVTLKDTNTNTDSGGSDSTKSSNSDLAQQEHVAEPQVKAKVPKKARKKVLLARNTRPRRQRQWRL